MLRLLKQALREEHGQDLIEYALLAAFISLICVSLIQNIGATVNSWYKGYAAQVQTIPGGSGS